jgi:hypothetical protein
MRRAATAPKSADGAAQRDTVLFARGAAKRQRATTSACAGGGGHGVRRHHGVPSGRAAGGRRSDWPVPDALLVSAADR